VEAHPDPAAARSDAEQQLTPPELAELAARVRRVAAAVARSLPEPRRGDERPGDGPMLRLRESISENDRRIVEAINLRIDLVERMRAYKDSRGIPFHDGAREQELLDELRRANEGPLSPEGLEGMVLSLLDLTRREVTRERTEPGSEDE
jgi:chorismate mutase